MATTKNGTRRWRMVEVTDEERHDLPRALEVTQTWFCLDKYCNYAYNFTSTVPMVRGQGPMPTPVSFPMMVKQNLISHTEGMHYGDNPRGFSNSSMYRWV